MSDTGAPWNLPYPLSTDLVRDGADAIKDLAEATATGLDAAGNAGIGSNVEYHQRLSAFSTTSTSLVDITDFEVTITPSDAASKILVLISLGNVRNSSGDVEVRFRPRRDTTDIYAEADGAKFVANRRGYGPSFLILDSPSTTSAITYSLRMRVVAGTGTLDFGSIAAIEVAA